MSEKDSSREKKKKAEEEQNTEKKQKPNFHFFRHVLIAAVSSIITETIVAPLERVKLIMQVQALRKHTHGEKLSSGDIRRGIVFSFRKIIQKQGYISLWRGNSGTIMYTLPNQSFTFPLKDKIVSFVAYTTGLPMYNTPVRAMLIGCASGASAGAIMQCAVYPMDYARTKLATDLRRGKRNVFSILGKTYKNEGWKGVYRGVSVSMLGVAIYRCYFGVFDMGTGLTPVKHQGTLHGRLLPAFIASGTASFLAYPLDTIRRTVMIRRPRDGDVEDQAMYAARKIYRRSGLKGFYYGGLANLLRSTGGAIMLVIYNTIKSSSVNA